MTLINVWFLFKCDPSPIPEDILASIIVPHISTLEGPANDKPLLTINITKMLSLSFAPVSTVSK